MVKAILTMHVIKGLGENDFIVTTEAECINRNSIDTNCLPSPDRRKAKWPKIWHKSAWNGNLVMRIKVPLLIVMLIRT